jgi:uncharacterized membrane protein
MKFPKVRNYHAVIGGAVATLVAVLASLFLIFAPIPLEMNPHPYFSLIGVLLSPIITYCWWIPKEEVIFKSVGGYPNILHAVLQGVAVAVIVFLFLYSAQAVDIEWIFHILEKYNTIL